MSITVILCTFNRCQRLAEALRSVADSTVPDSIPWEVLVVDNNSSDQTRDVVQDFCERYPKHFRYLHEPKQGKSYALNSGICEARGDILVFMDDDVTVEPLWLSNLTAALHSCEWVGAGGRIVPEWPGPPPIWLPRKSVHSLAPLVAFDRGDQAGELLEAPYGTNMAFRKEMFEKYGGFRTDLGRCPGNLIGAEDSEFGSRLLAAGERLRYEPSAVVYHPVTEDRIQKGYFLTWWFGKGRANIRQFGVQPNTKYFFCGIPLYLFRRFSVWTLRWMVAIDSSLRFESRLKVWAFAGEIVECYRQDSDAKKQKDQRHAETRRSVS